MTLFSDIQKFSERPCLISEEGQVTFSQVAKAADDLFAPCAPLHHGLAFVQAYNSVDALIAYIAAVRRGFAVHLLDPAKTEENSALVDAYKPDVLVDVRSDNPVDIRGDGLGIHPDIAILLSTSGSTGAAKFVKLTHDNIGSNTHAIIDYLKMSDRDCGVTNLKLFYSYGMSVVNTHLVSGAALVVTDLGTDDPAFWDLVSREKITNIAGVPYNFEVMHKAKIDLGRLPSLRVLTQAGGKLAPQMVQDFAESGARSGVEFCVMYGQTEASPRMAYLPPEQAHESPEAIGRAIPGGKLYIVDEARKPVMTADTAGELVYEGPNVMAGYANNRSDLSKIEHIPALYTGDIAHFDDRGLFYITGRASRFVKPFGLRISLDEIEHILQEEQTMVAVTGTDEQIVIALADPVPSNAQLATRLGARFGLPPNMFTVTSGHPIPRLPNGKTDYNRLLMSCETEGKNLSLPGFFLREFVGILTGQAQKPASVYDAFRSVLGHRVADRTTTFRTAGGDSLTYMQLYLQLEEFMGTVPENWTDMTIAEFDSLQETQVV